MGGVSFEDAWEESTSTVSNTAQNRNIVFVGKTGNGKSSTCNSVIGRDGFKSEMSSAGVTITCQLQSTIQNNRIINVIDTPDRKGIHAVVVVFSLRARFSQEEDNVIERLRKFFGNKITDYMIVVFTGGDDLGKKTLDDYLRGCPMPLQETMKMCGNRCLVFDNKTDDAAKKSEQLQKLLHFVELVVNNNGGKPYTDELFVEVNKYPIGDGQVYTSAGSSKKDMTEFKEQLNIITEMVELKLRVTTRWLEEQLAKEHASRVKAEAESKDAQRKSDDEMRIMRDELERARVRAEAETRYAQKKSDEEMRTLRDKLERAEEQKKEQILKDSLEKAEKEAEQLRKEQEWRDKLERAEKDVEELKKKGNCASL